MPRATRSAADTRLEESPASEPEKTEPQWVRGRTELPRALRPAEKLLSSGPAALATIELLGVVLGRTNGVETQRRARRVLQRHGTAALAGWTVSDWRRHGFSVRASARLAAVFELGRRAGDTGRSRRRVQINGPLQAHRHVRHLAHARREHLVGLYLDAQNGLLRRETISIGSLNTTRSHPREILFPAVRHLALGFILAHNHPSGSLEPSSEDLEFTSAVRRAGELIGIELYDHLIVAEDGFTSLRERGLL